MLCGRPSVQRLIVLRARDSPKRQATCPSVRRLQHSTVRKKFKRRPVEPTVMVPYSPRRSGCNRPTVKSTLMKASWPLDTVVGCADRPPWRGSGRPRSPSRPGAGRTIGRCTVGCDALSAHSAKSSRRHPCHRNATALEGHGPGRRAQSLFQGHEAKARRVALYCKHRPVELANLPY